MIVPLSIENYITTIHNSYVFGNPVTLSIDTVNVDDSKQDIFVEKLDDFKWGTSYAQKINQLGFEAIGGRYSWAQLEALDSGEIKLHVRHGWECFPDVSGAETIGFVYLYKQAPDIMSKKTKPFYIIWYYSEDGTIYKYQQSFNSSGNIEYTLIGESENLFDTFPFIQFRYNYFNMAQYEFVAKLIDVIDKQKTTDVNQLFEFALSYLIGLDEFTKEQIKAARDSGYISGPNADKLRFLVKDLSTEFSDYLNTDNWKLIHQLSMTVNLEQVSGGDTGVARRFLLQLQEYSASTGVLLFQESLKEMWAIITEYWGRVENIEITPTLIKNTFTRNIPVNLLEDAKIQEILEGLVSDKTRFELAPFIPDVEKEIERKKSQSEENNIEETDTVKDDIE